MKFTRRGFLISVSIVALSRLYPVKARFPHGDPGGWHNLKIGAGGFVTTFDIAPDGTSRLAGTDTTGAYLQNVDGSWKQLIRAPGFPDASDALQMNGVYAVVSAPSDPTRIYMAYQPSQSAGSATGYNRDSATIETDIKKPRLVNFTSIYQFPKPAGGVPV